ncbi:hypothetical protein HD554DRAFT_2010549, partial [Boletus coccyginus]
LPSQAVQAQPPSANFLLEHCDVVLLNMDGQSEHNLGYYVAQVWVVFQLASPVCSRDKPPHFLAQPLLYIQPFDITAIPDDQPNTWLWMLKRVFSDPCCPGSVHVGLIIPLTVVTQAVDLMPMFGACVNRELSAAISQEVYNEFYLNHYMDKEYFNIFYKALDTMDNENLDDKVLD